MSKKIEKLKRELRKALKEELGSEVVEVILTLNSYGFYTYIGIASVKDLELRRENKRNIHGNWIK
jgi:NTP pyrophosphatase (non-canonical NTP hydrolase)